MVLDAIVLGIAAMLTEIILRALDLDFPKGLRALVYLLISLIWTFIRMSFNS